MYYGANNTYKALRIVGKDYNLYYSVWCTNEHELYDLTVSPSIPSPPISLTDKIPQNDPHQLNNLYPTTSYTLSSTPEPTILNIPISKVLPRLDALLLVTKSCKAHTCVDPWSVIHPKGDVKTLGDALNVKFDGFYRSLKEERKVGFTKCELGYIKESEGVQELGVVFDEDVKYEL